MYSMIQLIEEKSAVEDQYEECAGARSQNFSVYWFYFDRQKEHAPNEPRSRKYPIFTFDGQLHVRCNPTLVRNGYQLAGEVLDEEGEAALTVLQDVLSDESLWWEGMLERGQVQFLNNRDLAHTRTPFRDTTDSALKRHLVRYWLRDEGPIFFL